MTPHRSSRLGAMYDAAAWAAAYECYSQDHNGEEGRWLDRFAVTHLVWFLWMDMKRVFICGMHGHDFEDTGSWAGPDSGGEDLTCRRCGFNVRHIYY